MRKIEFPIGKKKEIIAMYSDKDIPVSEILETYRSGSDVRSESDKLLDKLAELWTYVYPCIDYETKEEAKKIFNDVTTYIKNH